MFQAIIWDFDGTLVDTYPEIARTVNEALATFDKSASSERITELSSISLDFCMTELSKEFGISQDELNEQFSITYATVRPEDQKPFPHVLEVCKMFQETGGHNFIVTHRRKKSLHQLLETHHLTPYFTDIIAGDDGFPRKPDPSAMRYLVDKYALSLESLLVVGDRDIDILAGGTLGAKTCLFRGSFQNGLPDFAINSFSELFVRLKTPRKKETE